MNKLIEKNNNLSENIDFYLLSSIDLQHNFILKYKDKIIPSLFLSNHWRNQETIKVMFKYDNFVSQLNIKDYISLIKQKNLDPKFIKKILKKHNPDYKKHPLVWKALMRKYIKNI